MGPSSAQLAALRTSDTVKEVYNFAGLDPEWQDWLSDTLGCKKAHIKPRSWGQSARWMGRR